MGLFDSILSPVESIVKTGINVGKSIVGGVTGLFGMGSNNMQDMMADQIADYRRQTELAQSEIARKRGEELVEKRRIEENQIRALRGHFSNSGFLGSGSDNTNPGNATIPSKLGA